MRLAQLLVILSGLVLLTLKFSFDIRYQNPNSPLGIFGYYLPAFLSIAFIVLTLIRLLQRERTDPKSIYLNLVTIGLSVYAIIWQFIYLKYIFSRLSSGGIEIYLMEFFPLLVAMSCTTGIVIATTGALWSRRK